MEGLIKRTWIVAGIVLAYGAFTMYVPPRRQKPVNEDWMAQNAPETVSGYGYQPSAEDPGCSYKMGDVTYSTLQPSGILARLYKSGDKVYDVVLIASDNSVSFHDPRVCFTASGWDITGQKQAKLETQTRGEIPVTVVQMKGDGENKSALYFYKSPSGFESVARKMRWNMLLGELMHGRNDQGVFYRFIPMSSNISDAELQKFAATYLDEANKTSKGFF